MSVAPQVSPDIRFVDSRTAGRELNRWIVFPGDIIIQRRKWEMDWLRAGGEELNSPCLLRYGRGYLPRGFITPLEMGVEFFPVDNLPPGVNYSTGLELDGVPLEQKRPTEAGYRSPNLAQIPVYPGDALSNIMAAAMNDQGRRRGIVEISSLKGKEWKELRSFNPGEKGFLDVLDEVYFGDGREPTLKGLEDQITQGKTTFPESAEIADQMLRACFEFRDWAMSKLDQEHTALRATPSPGQEPAKYSPLAELLLVQLEVERMDQPMKSLADQNLALGHHLQSALQGIASQNQGFDMERFAQIMADARKDDAQRIARLEARLASLQPATESDAVTYDLTGERPEGVHHKTWEKLRRDAGLE